MTDQVSQPTIPVEPVGAPQPISPSTQTPLPATPTVATPPPAQSEPTSSGTPTSHAVITIVLLLIFPLIGIILMWVWTKWSKAVKWIVTILFIIGQLIVIMMIPVILAAMLMAVNPAAQIERANMVKESGGYENMMENAGETTFDEGEGVPMKDDFYLETDETMGGESKR